MSDTPTSILVADIGAVATKVGLIDAVAGEFRLIGSTRTLTTDAPPHSDVAVGVKQGLLQLEMLVGRRLLTDTFELITPARPNGDGADTLVAVTSAGLPLHAVVIGLSRDYSVASAQRALTCTYATVDHTIAVDEESGRWGTTAQDGRAGGPSAAVERLASAHPDLIVMVGGIDGGAVAPLCEMANIVAAVGAALDESQRPLLIFAGNRQARTDVAERIGGLLEMRVVDNVLPTLDQPNPEPLQREIENVYRERQIENVPGMDKIIAWSGAGVMTAADGYARVVRYLAQKYQLRVLAVDLGAATTVLLRADGERLTQAIVEEVSVGYGMSSLLHDGGLERLARWLPSGLDLKEVHANVLNHSVRPWTMPSRAQDLYALNAAARETLLHGVNAWRSDPTLVLAENDLIVVSGAPVAFGAKAGALMTMLLDALDVRGIFSIAADPTGLAAAVGAVAGVNGEAAAQVLENDGLVTLGTAFVPQILTTGTEGLALTAVVEPTRGGRLTAEVKLGSLELIPLGEGEKANVSIRPHGGVDLGVPLKSGVFRREVQGGSAGLLIDARGRPLPVLENLERQREKAQQWLWEVGG